MATAPAAAPAVPLQKQETESAREFAARVFRSVFEEDVQRLLNMATLWTERKVKIIRMMTVVLLITVTVVYT